MPVRLVLFAMARTRDLIGIYLIEETRRRPDQKRLRRCMLNQFELRNRYMTANAILIYCFFLGLLHGIIPDEHTWPITFSYSIGAGSGRAGMLAGIYFASAFTVQRTLLSELSCLALAPFVKSQMLSELTYLVAGAVMVASGVILLRRDGCSHLCLFGGKHRAVHDASFVKSSCGDHREGTATRTAPPARWALTHGFIAGFGMCGFSLFVNTVAAPAMPTALMGFLPGLLFGLGTTAMLALVGAVFGFSLRFLGDRDEEALKRVGARIGTNTLIFGGLLFVAAGAAMLGGAERYLPVDIGNLVIWLFVLAVALPTLFTMLKNRPQGSGNPVLPALAPEEAMREVTV
jgi:Cytochrome C biogenesis protein transmembrane region